MLCLSYQNLSYWKFETYVMTNALPKLSELELLKIWNLCHDVLIDYTDSDLLQDDPHRLQKDEGLHHQSYHGLRCKFMYSEKKSWYDVQLRIWYNKIDNITYIEKGCNLRRSWKVGIYHVMSYFQTFTNVHVCNI